MYSYLCQEIEEQFQYEAEWDQAMADGKQKFSSTYNIGLLMKLPTSRRKLVE